MKQIYNEGRVTGLSMWEIYLRQLMSTNPEATPMTEREWLTSTLANNSSMILKIPAKTDKGIHDYVLPEGSNLAACTQVFGSLFLGEVTTDISGFWAIRVNDYGDAISNTETLHPDTPGTPEYVPSKEDPTQENITIAQRATEFLKIREALVIQPGEWEDAEYPPDPHHGEIVTWESPLIDSVPVYRDPRDVILTTEDDEWLVEDRTGTWEEMVADLSQYDPQYMNAKKYLKPDFKKNGFVRILLTERTEHDTYILLHGFVDKLILQGEVSFPYQGASNRPADGDFLGPATFPWSCPVILIVSTDVEEVILKQQASINKQLQESITTLYYRTLYLGTLHVVRWDAGLATEYDDVLITEDGDMLVATREGTVAQMWQEDSESAFVYNVPWWDDYERQIATEDRTPLWVPKLGTMSEFIADEGKF